MLAIQIQNRTPTKAVKVDIQVLAIENARWTLD